MNNYIPQMELELNCNDTSVSTLNYDNIAIMLSGEDGVSKDNLEYFNIHFAGKCYVDLESFSKSTAKVIYLTGNISINYEYIKDPLDKIIYVIKEYSSNYEYDTIKYEVIPKKQIPVNFYGQGVFFENFFKDDKDYFDLLTTQHVFQELRESNKEGVAYRSGIYLSKVEKKDQDYHFNLLRCSTNLKGSTDNFRETDIEIMTKVNKTAEIYFENNAELNHVLAQVYQNVMIDSKERKAKIKAHSDKTKDMPSNGLMAFCTFYKKSDQNITPKALTTLRFCKKSCVNDEKLKDKFDVVLTPNSVFMMSLLTNRYYTHEIVPSQMSIEKIPIRLGYVIRCSNVKAVYKEGETFIVEGDQLVKMKKPTDEDITHLRHLYYTENVSDHPINYGKIHFSMNEGDYTQPLL
jgi:hypothetical protein